MKKKLKGLIGLMSVCAVGAISGAFALERQGANVSGTAGHYDQAVYLYWGGAQSSLELAPCDELTANVAEYRYFAVAPQTTKSVAGTVTVSFELAENSGDYHISGLTVKVYGADQQINDENKGTYVVEGNLVATLTSAAKTGSDTFSVTANTEKHTTTKYYAVEVVYDGTFVSGKTLGGTLVIGQSFEA